MIAYAESSAVLSWLLGEGSEGGEEGKRGERDVRRRLAEAERVVSSTLTRVECTRALARGVITRRLTAAEELAALKLLDLASSSWVTLELAGRVLDRAQARFPREPVRTLDALHLATAMIFHEAYGAVVMVSLDDRIRDNAADLGLGVAP